ncbi:MAG: hypothetical protein ACREA0_33800, partial [bacterium]
MSEPGNSLDLSRVSLTFYDASKERQMRDLPTGTVTFLFTDIEGSTRLLQRLGDRYREVVDRHGQRLVGGDDQA